MDFSLSDEARELRRSAIEFARSALVRDEGVAPEEYFRTAWRRCAEFGVQGLPIPEEYGGSAQDVMSATAVLEALGYGCRDQGLLFSLHAQIWSIEMPILRFGSEEQKRRLLPALCDGSLIGAHCMTEPGSGSDAFALRTRAERAGDEYVLNGSKTFATNAPEAGLFLVFATVDATRGIWGITGFLIDRNTPGLNVGRHLDKLGLTTSPTAEVFLQDCRVPADQVLGRVGQGSVIFNHSMAWERSCILGSTVGAMEWQLERCLDYVKERRQFGRPIGSFELVAARLADMKTRLETSRLLLYRAAWAHATGKEVELHGAMAKLHISEAAVQSSLDAIQLFGGYGYTPEFGVERDLRDAVGSRLYSGTSEIQRMLIARRLGLNPA